MAGKLRHFLAMSDLTPKELRYVLTQARALKSHTKKVGGKNALQHRTMAMIFEKPSLRTHFSFETGMTQLGGHSIYLGPENIGLGQREPIKDVSNVLSRMADIVIARVFKNETVTELAEHSIVPVINALCDKEHPCQTIADLLTIDEHIGLDSKPSVAFVGDGNNNVTHSLAVGCAMLGLDFRVASPAAHAMSPKFSALANEYAKKSGSSVLETQDAFEAVDGVDVIYTDTFVSMGDEDRKDELVKEFDGYQVTTDMMAAAAKDAYFMHDMPAYRGIEVQPEVIDGDRSIIYKQAENRLHGQKAIIGFLLAHQNPNLINLLGWDELPSEE